MPISVLGFVLQEAGRDAEAERRWRRLRELRPEDPTVMNNLAFLLAERGGSLEEAKQLAQQAVAAAPGQTSYADTLGWVYVKLKAYDAARTIFEQAVKKEPRNAVYWYHLGVTQTETGLRAEAQASLQRALESRPPALLEKQIRAAMTW